MKSVLVLSLFIIFAILLIIGQAFPFEENLRSEIDLLRQQIKEKRDAGNLQEARELQNILKDKVSRRYGSGSEEPDYDAMIQDRIKAHQESRRQSSKMKYSGSSTTKGGRSSSRKKGGNKASGDGSKFSDSRALHQMDQTHRKADILRNKIGRGGSLFTADETASYHQRIQEYIEAEEKVAASLQATADDYNKARSMRDKESRLKHLEGAKARKQDRHKDEYNLREISRQKFFSLNDELDGRLATLSEL